MFLISNNPGVKSDNTPGFFEIEKNVIKFLYYPYPIYFALEDKFYYISDNLKKIRDIIKTQNDINGILQLLIFNSNFYPFSLYKEITPLHPYTQIEINDNKPVFKKIKKKYKELSKKDFFNNLDKMFDIYCNSNTDKYLLFSGGLDSSLIKYHLKGNILYGTTLYNEITKKECREILENNENIIYLRDNREVFFRMFENIKFEIPFINPGYIDDRLHIDKALENGILDIYTGTGADEFTGDYSIVKEKNIDMNAEWFSKNVFSSLFHHIKDLFLNENISEIFTKSLEWFNFETKKDKIEFIRNCFLISNQNALMKNNISENNKIVRVNPFISEEFNNMCLSLNDDLLENNQIEKYILKEFACKKGFNTISMRLSKDFDYRSDLNYSKDFDEFIQSNIKLFPALDNPDFVKKLKDLSNDTKIKLSIFLKILKDL